MYRPALSIPPEALQLMTWQCCGADIKPTHHHDVCTCALYKAWASTLQCLERVQDPARIPKELDVRMHADH